jgi:hypothetical protein
MSLVLCPARCRHALAGLRGPRFSDPRGRCAVAYTHLAAERWSISTCRRHGSWTDIGISATSLPAYFDCTEAEAYSAASLVDSISLEEHARARGVRIRSARRQLKRVLPKSGCRANRNPDGLRWHPLPRIWADGWVRSALACRSSILRRTSRCLESMANSVCPVRTVSDEYTQGPSDGWVRSPCRRRFFSI